MSETLQVYLLGEFRLYREGVFISPKDWHTRQARQLFKVLLTEYGHVVSMRKLMSLLWPDYSEGAYKTLRSAISTLRTVLEPGRGPHALSRYIPRGNTGYTLVFPPDAHVWIDAREFERRLDEALAAPVQNSAERREMLEEALRLYAGDYLAEDEGESWAWAERLRLRERYFAGAISLMNWQHAARLYTEAIVIGHQALKFDPCREPIYRLIMQCQAHLGNSAGALQTFERCRQVLAERLGADPAPQTLKLHTLILQGEFPKRTLSTMAVDDVRRRENGFGRGRATKRRNEPACIGRKAELACFEQQLRELQMQPVRSARTVAVVGEAGVGKSFLVRRFLERAREAGASFMMAQCQAIEQNISFVPLASMLNAWLLEASDEQLRMLPRAELALIAPLLPGLAARLSRDMQVGTGLPVVNPEQAYSTLIAGLVDIFAALCQQGPLVLAWDDLQWADESTLLVINRLACLERAALLLVISYRPEDLSENEPLDRMLRYLRRGEHTSTLPLSRFSPGEVAEYLALHKAAPPLQAETLYQTTQGNALFLVEAVRTLLEQKARRPQANDLAADLADEAIASVLQSERIHDVVLARVARLPERAVDLLKIAAVIGRPFSLDLLQSRLSEDDYQALNVLLARRFLVEVGPGEDYEVRLAFSHEMVGQIIAASCSALQLRQLHQHVADQLVRRYAPDTEAHAAEIAFHYRRCGTAFECLVVRYEVKAGDYARHSFSYRQALVHYDAALQLLPHLAPDRRTREREEWTRRAYAGRALVYEALLDWEGVQESYRYLGNGSDSRRDPVQSGSSARRMAGIRSLMGHLSEAADMGLSAIQRLRAEAVGLSEAPDGTRKSVSALIDMTQRWTSLLTVEEVVSGEVSEQAMQDDFPEFQAAMPPSIQDWYEMIEVLEPAQAALTLVEYGWALLLQGFTTDAEQCLKAALQAAEETDQVTCWVLGAMHLSRVYHLCGRPEEGQRWFEQCIERGKRASEATWSVIWPLLNKAYALTAQNHLDEAERLLQMLNEQIERQGDFLAHRYSVQIGCGLVALARGEVRRAEGLLSEALEHPRSLYIEAYVLAELGLVQIVRLQGRDDEAQARLRNILAFCGRRSLLEYYAVTGLTLARHSIRAGQMEGLLPLLEQVSQLVAGAGYADMQRQCRELLARVSAAVR